MSSQTREDNSSLEAQKQEFIQQGVPEKNIWLETGSATDKIEDLTIILNWKKMICCLLPKLICVVEIDLNFKNYKSNFIKKELNLPYSTDMDVY